MIMTQPTPGRSTYRDLHCPHCNTPLPPQALFCSFCGKQIKKGKSRKWKQRPENNNFEAQVPNTATVRIIPLKQVYLKYRQTVLSQSMPTTSALSTSRTWQQIPETEEPTVRLGELAVPSTPVPDIDTKEIDPGSSPRSLKEETTESLLAISHKTPEEIASKPSSANWLWPTIILLSTIAVSFVTFVMPNIAVRPFIVMAFLFVCPGMVLVRFLHLHELAVEWTLAIALSFSIDAAMASIFLYAGKWSPTGILSLLIGICLCGAIVHLATPGATSFSKHLRFLFSMKPAAFIPILLTLLGGVIVGMGLWFLVASYGSHHLF